MYPWKINRLTKIGLQIFNQANLASKSLIRQETQRHRTGHHDNIHVPHHKSNPTHHSCSTSKVLLHTTERKFTRRCVLPFTIRTGWM
ncbi:hypothetical protein HanIR_Chr05g0251851 [Helianthus annuus]|nr:hypothetical protein HanIR_Chr05g0251851 [Helianthus annuus]